MWHSSCRWHHRHQFIIPPAGRRPTEAASCLLPACVLMNMCSNNDTIMKWQGMEQQELPVLIGALLNAHHALHPWQMSMGGSCSSPSMWRCCSLDADVQTSLGVGETRSSLRRLQRNGSEAHSSSFATGFNKESPWQTFGEAVVEEVGSCSEGRARCGAQRQFSSGDISLASNTTAHQKKTHASSLRLALYLPIPFFSLCYQGEGLTSPTPARRGWCKKALQSPLSPTHDGLGRRRKRSESRVGREKGKPSVLEIYIATLKARIAGGPCQSGEGTGREALVLPCQLSVWENGSFSQGPGKRAVVLQSCSLVVAWM